MRIFLAYPLFQGVPPPGLGLSLASCAPYPVTEDQWTGFDLLHDDITARVAALTNTTTHQGRFQHMVEEMVLASINSMVFDLREPALVKKSALIPLETLALLQHFACNWMSPTAPMAVLADEDSPVIKVLFRLLPAAPRRPRLYHQPDTDLFAYLKKGVR